ncbi:hypothetical protein CFter6_3452 [Collimonas fungivorans]|uniref:Uncharacterized protein n=1 Tax=Collimonas fungivorans TaxID=158899 RepID=A0A127PEE6_9BURK|nr:hypothetical protein CFter6_3452 [Collimonas fungivorans]
MLSCNMRSQCDFSRNADRILTFSNCQKPTNSFNFIQIAV